MKRLVIASVVAVGVLVALAYVRGRAARGKPPHDEPSKPATGEPPLQELSKAELYGRAQAAGIPGRSQMSKDELIRALRAL
jgi:DNA end-binding protein Ku